MLRIIIHQISIVFAYMCTGNYKFSSGWISINFHSNSKMGNCLNLFECHLDKDPFLDAIENLRQAKGSSIKWLRIKWLKGLKEIGEDQATKDKGETAVGGANKDCYHYRCWV
ncbi:hypothetical protein Dimus_000355 [Dionaea muscipula]